MLWLATNTIRGLGAYGRTLIRNENYNSALWLATKTIKRLELHERALKRVTDGLTYTDHDISGYASSRQVATKIRDRGFFRFYQIRARDFISKNPSSRLQ